MNKLITISSALLTTAAVKAQTPNIVFILADDLGYGDISAFNPESKIHTPNIDKLAEHGIREPKQPTCLHVPTLSDRLNPP